MGPDEKSPSMAGLLTNLPHWLSRKGAVLVLAAGISCLSLFFLSSFSHEMLPSFVSGVDDTSLDASSAQGLPLNETFVNLPECGADRQRMASPEIWNAAEEKYGNLTDDKFTVAILTYRRPDMLQATIAWLTYQKVPSLYEVVVIWNDIEVPPPKGFVSQHGVRVRYRVSSYNSMNMKFFPDPEYRTKAILLHDDDVHYTLDDMEFAFQTWRSQGQYRITGAFPRCALMNSDGNWGYSFCTQQGYYNMVLTGLLFTHVSFLEYYSSADPLMTRIRKYVDDIFNCDDLAFNFIAAMLTCTGPYQAVGANSAFNAAPPGISAQPSHMPTRHQCLRDFPVMFGYMPLKNTTEHLVRGPLFDGSPWRAPIAPPPASEPLPPVETPSPGENPPLVTPEENSPPVENLPVTPPVDNAPPVEPPVENAPPVENLPPVENPPPVEDALSVENNPPVDNPPPIPPVDDTPPPPPEQNPPPGAI
ncbi:glycosyl transferase family 64 domain-containing protein [Ilyonectria sp. MPI-CAGE-AT-0026]|nr:glycosyl transferase family 64 domain-containing protein [Ilyonectria sp. MPI-CAGE-AT-0026]